MPTPTSWTNASINSVVKHMDFEWFCFYAFKSVLLIMHEKMLFFKILVQKLARITFYLLEFVLSHPEYFL